jgi:cell division protein FtsB
VTQAATVKTTSAPRRRGGRTGGRRAGPPRLHLGRLAILLLVLIGASFYVAPLRQFFAQQDRYQRETTALQAARTDNAVLKHQVELLTTKSYVGQRARADSMLVPPNTQVFVVKGLPGRDEEGVPTAQSEPATGSFSVIDRIKDLWRTLLH